jgi:hypothetical protein
MSVMINPLPRAKRARPPKGESGAAAAAAQATKPAPRDNPPGAPAGNNASATAAPTGFVNNPFAQLLEPTGAGGATSPTE